MFVSSLRLFSFLIDPLCYMHYRLLHGLKSKLKLVSVDTIQNKLISLQEKFTDLCNYIWKPVNKLFKLAKPETNIGRSISYP